MVWFESDRLKCVHTRAYIDCNVNLKEQKEYKDRKFENGDGGEAYWTVGQARS